jgi:hemolysin III
MSIPKVKITEEIFNSIAHGLGAFAGIVALVLGIIFLNTSSSFKVAYIVYCSSLIILMLMSSIYHALKFTKASRVFQFIDHSSIFLLIAGSFTPFITFLFRGWQEGLLLGLVWLIAFAGIAVTVTLVLPKSMKITGVILYISFGWLALFLIPKIGMVAPSVIWLLLLGGILYTLGVIPFAIKKPFSHFTWHIFVIAAAFSHFLAILKLA